MSLAILTGDGFSNKHNQDRLFLTIPSTKKLLQASYQLLTVTPKQLQ